MRVSPIVSLASIVLFTACASPPPPATPAPPPAPAPAPRLAVAPPSPVADAGAALPPTPDDVRELQRAILASHGAVDVVASITTEVGARLAGSPGDKLAVAWALRTMQEHGLANVHAEPVKVRTWQRGVETASIVSPMKHTLAVTALGWSGATPSKGVEGDVVRVESIEALKKAEPKTLAGKIVFLDKKMERTASGMGYGDAVGGRAVGPAEAKKKGALAFVIRSIGTDQSRFPHTGATHQDDEKAALPAAALSVADADLLDRVLTAHGSARMALNLGPKWLPPADSANVVGEVVGESKPNEVVLMGAHLDSWDLAEGAIDDGAGCGIVLEAARAIGSMPKKPQRTVRVVLFAAEENQVAGGKEYAHAHEKDAPSIIVAMEADAGGDKVLSARFGGAPEARPRFLTLAPALEPLSIAIDDGGAYGGADVSPLRPLGVPLIDLEQDFTRYFDTHHTANDTFDRIDPAAIQQAAAAFASAAWTIANLSGDFGRAPPEEPKPQ